MSTHDNKALLLAIQLQTQASINNVRFAFWVRQHEHDLARRFARSGQRDEWHWLCTEFERACGLMVAHPQFCRLGALRI